MEIGDNMQIKNGNIINSTPWNNAIPIENDVNKDYNIVDYLSDQGISALKGVNEPNDVAQTAEEFIISTLINNPKDRLNLMKIEKELIDFLNTEDLQIMKFPEMTSYNRMLVHKVAAYFDLDHNVDLAGNSVIISKTDKSKIPDIRFQEKIYQCMSNDIEQPSYITPSVKCILKRSAMGNNTDVINFDKNLITTDKLLKTLEEREEQYQLARARIFQEMEGIAISETNGDDINNQIILNFTQEMGASVCSCVSDIPLSSCILQTSNNYNSSNSQELKNLKDSDNSLQKKAFDSIIQPILLKEHTRKNINKDIKITTINMIPNSIEQNYISPLLILNKDSNNKINDDIIQKKMYNSHAITLPHDNTINNNCRKSFIDKQSSPTIINNNLQMQTQNITQQQNNITMHHSFTNPRIDKKPLSINSVQNTNLNRNNTIMNSKNNTNKLDKNSSGNSKINFIHPLLLLNQTINQKLFPPPLQNVPLKNQFIMPNHFSQPSATAAKLPYNTPHHPSFNLPLNNRLINNNIVMPLNLTHPDISNNVQTLNALINNLNRSCNMNNYNNNLNNYSNIIFNNNANKNILQQTGFLINNFNKNINIGTNPLVSQQYISSMNSNSVNPSISNQNVKGIDRIQMRPHFPQSNYRKPIQHPLTHNIIHLNDSASKPKNIVHNKKNSHTSSKNGKKSKTKNKNQNSIKQPTKPFEEDEKMSK